MTSNVPKICDSCGKKYFSQSNLDKHKQKMHGDQIQHLYPEQVDRMEETLRYQLWEIPLARVKKRAEQIKSDFVFKKSLEPSYYPDELEIELEIYSEFRVRRMRIEHKKLMAALV